MEAVEHGPAVPALDGDALHVHARVDGAHRQPEDDQRGHQLRHVGGETRGHHRDGDGGLGDAQQPPAAPARGERSRAHAADSGQHRHHEQQEGEVAFGEAVLVLQGCDLREESRETQALHGEDREGGRSGLTVTHVDLPARGET
ncbi:hypothetical protein [Nonomuraea dietziae]|uniref:Uncharacterized protein n=1 Tax=Nonomuraea dietziae TaxID=65515 RepID=A0A7W5V7A8_9ACTN|nr:hypothetical protein [Nonomuraea dietziae]MBB3730544.1 hypothetical protein [Nonomuraea dietziae]